MKKILFLVFFFLISLSCTFATNVEIEAKIYNSYTLFTYNIDLEDESLNSFSLEKLEDSKVEEAQGDSGKLSYTTAGDFLIFKVPDRKASKFKLKIKSNLATSQIYNKESFSHYVSFNFPIDNLTFKLILIDNIGEIKEAFPRNFVVGKEGGIVWTQQNVLDDTLFLVNFKNVKNSKPAPSSNFSYVVVLLFLPIFLFIILFYIVKKSHQEENKKKEANKKGKKKVRKKIQEKKENVVKEKKSENLRGEKKETKFEEIVEKYLTENEKEIVKLIKENEGISQYDILNHLPKLTKSNLSKIISKLHSKRILNRIRVGKVNKIYLGERTEGEEKSPQE